MNDLKLYERLRKDILLLFDTVGIYCESLSSIINYKPIDKSHYEKLIKQPEVSRLGLFEQFYKSDNFGLFNKMKIKYLGTLL